MKLTINEDSKSDNEYPYIGIDPNDNQIVYFWEDNTGLDLQTGFFDDNWEESLFEKFNGTITLEN